MKEAGPAGRPGAGARDPGRVPAQARVVRIGGREFRVRFARESDGRLFAEVEDRGERSRLEVAAASEGGLLLAGEPLEARLARRAGSGYLLHAGGTALPVEVLTEIEATLAATLRPAGEAAPDLEVRAPMPGRLLAVEVAEGEAVPEGAGLFIIEAMKMENEIRAIGAGRVRGLRVAAGDTVDGDQLLCEITPLPGGGV